MNNSSCERRLAGSTEYRGYATVSLSLLKAFSIPKVLCGTKFIWQLENLSWSFGTEEAIGQGSGGIGAGDRHRCFGGQGKGTQQGEEGRARRHGEEVGGEGVNLVTAPWPRAEHTPYL